MSKQYRNHIIQNIKNKSILHKKGKRWIVLSLSALVLGLGISAASLTTHADISVPRINTSQIQELSNNSGNNRLSDIQHQADNLHGQIVSHSVQRNMQKPSAKVAASAMPQAKGAVHQDDNGYNNAVHYINQYFIHDRTLDTSHYNSHMGYQFYDPYDDFAVDNGTGTPTTKLYGNIGDEVFLHHSDNKHHINNAVYVSDYVYDKRIYDKATRTIDLGMNQYLQVNPDLPQSSPGKFYVLPSDKTELNLISQGGHEPITQQADGSIGTLGSTLSRWSNTQFVLQPYYLIGNDFVDNYNNPISGKIHHVQIASASDLTVDPSGSRPILNINNGNAADYG